MKSGFCRPAYGYKHLYLYTLDGTLIRQLTSGEWPVTKVSKVDEEGGWVYFEGWTETPLERHLYRVSLEGDPEGRGRQDARGPGEVEQITEAPGWHQAVLGPKSSHLIDIHSSLLAFDRAPRHPRVYIWRTMLKEWPRSSCSTKPVRRYRFNA